MNQLKKIETEITPKGRTEDGTGAKGIESTGTRESDAVSLRQQAGVTEGTGKPLGDTMAFGTTDTGAAARGEQGVATSLIEYVEELTKTEQADFYRPNFWPNTPDILPYALQSGNESIYLHKYFLAATLSSSVGIYGPVYEYMVSEAMPDNVS